MVYLVTQWQFSWYYLTVLCYSDLLSIGVYSNVFGCNDSIVMFELIKQKKILD